MMKYQSTRGGYSGLSFEDTLFSGYAGDLGLFMPACIPSISKAQLEKWKSCDYISLTQEILRLFVDEKEIPDNDFSQIIRNAFKKFDTENVIEVRHLSNGVIVLELFHGPTRAFKDLSLQAIGQFAKYYLNRNSRNLTILVGTSGDTGSAVIEAFRSVPNASVMVLYPKGRVTETQELLMTTVSDRNIHCFEVDGTSDDLDIPIRKIFEDEEFCKEYNVICLNSINLVRILVQISHFFYAYLKCASQLKDGQHLKVVVPFGGGGNITAACMARKMGLPIEIIAALNSNDVFAHLLKSEEFQFGEEIFQTLASAMDIGVPYNIERLLFMFSGNNAQCTSQIMQKLYLGQKASFPSDVISEMSRVIVGAHVADNSEIVATMKTCWSEEKYRICPHTAIAYGYCCQQQLEKYDEQIYVCIATASPSKFPEALEACGIPDEENIAENLRQIPKRVARMAAGEDWENILRQAVRVAKNSSHLLAYKPVSI